MSQQFTIEKIKKIVSGHKVRPQKPIEGYRPASVLVPFYEQPEGLSIIFTKRTEHLDSHSGQISFPGGGLDPEDADDLAAALRETHEEIGVKQSDIEVWGRLRPRGTATSNYWVSPFVGLIPYPYEFKLNDFEVERLVIVPLSHLLDSSNYTEDNYLWSGMSYMTSQYIYGQDVIWGLTAYMLNNFLALLKTGSELD